MLLKRLQRELKRLTKDPSIGCYAQQADPKDIYHWIGTIKGPIDTPYSGGTFKLDFYFPEDYPFKPPRIQFKTKVYHPNIDFAGNICLDILKENWSPVLGVGKILLSISSLLADPNPDSPLSSDVAHLYKYDRQQYNAIAIQWTKQYAT